MAVRLAEQPPTIRPVPPLTETATAATCAAPDVQALIVTADEARRQRLRLMLSVHGRQAAICADFAAAWAYCQVTLPPMIVFDEATGAPGEALAFCRRVRARAGGSRSVILALTHRARPDDLLALLDAGASAYHRTGVDDDLLGVHLVAAQRQAALISEQARTEDQLRFLAEVGVDLAGAYDETASLSTLARLIVPFFADYCAVDMVAPDGAIWRLALAGVEAEHAEELLAAFQRFPLDPDGPHLVAIAIRTGESQFTPVSNEEWLRGIAQDGEHLRLMRQFGARSRITVPVTVRGQRLGALSFGYAQSARHYRRDDLPLAEELARRAAVAVENLRLREDAQAEEQRFRSLVQHASDIIMILNHDLTTRYASPSIERVLGYPPEQVSNVSVLNGIHPRDVARLEQAVAERAFDSGVSPLIEVQVRHRDGSWRHLEVIVNNLLDDPGIRGFVLNARDVSERKSFEEKLKW